MEYAAQLNVIRELAKRLREISAEPQYASKRQKWADHNELNKNVEPLLWICPDDDGGWLELVPPEELQTQDQDLRELEIRIRRLIYHHEHFDDDFVIEPVIRFDLPGEYTGYHYGNAAQKSAWGVDIQGKKAGQGAYRLEDYLEDPRHVETLLNHEVDFIPDEMELARLRGKYNEALDGIVEAQFTLPYVVLVQSHFIELVHLYSLTSLMLALYDDPDKIHRILDHMSASKARLLARVEEKKLLFNNHTNIYTGSGGLGYTNQKLDEDNLKISQLWGFADAQEFSEISPEMFEEFALPYQKRGLNQFGYACYGCCEPLDNRLEAIFRQLPNIRRLSVSPWSNVEIAAEQIGSRAIYSWKPNPSLISNGLNADEAEPILRRAAAASKNCVTEIILKDIRTCGGKTPEHLQNFTKLVRRTFQ